MTPITVTVTAAHVQRGRRAHCEKCMVALAVRETPDRGPGHFEGSVLVDGQYVYLESTAGESKVFELPADVARAVRRFDAGGKDIPVPFSFTLAEEAARCPPPPSK